MEGAAGDIGSLPVAAMITGLGGGLALFLYGMRKLTDALKTLAGEGIKNTLARATTNRFSGLAAGAAVTALIQSSSVTTVLAVGLVSAGLLTFTQSIGIVMGANVGTTITAQMVAFKATKYALVLIAAGFLTELLARSPRLRQGGVALMGLGLLFFGMELMSETMAPLRAWPPFSELMQAARHPLLGVALGFLFTSLVQSSSATTGVVIVLAADGLVSLETGIALALGANVGTRVTAMLSAIGRPREAVRVALVHVVFNLLWVGFIPQFAELVRIVSPSAAELSGAARAAAETPRQVANAHTLFNVANALVFVWFATPIERLINRLLPAQPTRARAGQPRYLEPMYLDQPALALDRVRMEIERLGRRVVEIVRGSFDVVSGGDGAAIRRLRERDDDVDDLHGAIVDYLGDIATRDLVPPLPRRLQDLLGAANYFENAADVVAIDLMEAADERRANGLRLGDATAAAIADLHRAVYEALEEACAAFAAEDAPRALAVRERKGEMANLTDVARARASGELGSRGRQNLELYRVESDLIECYARVHALARRIARSVTLGERETPPG